MDGLRFHIYKGTQIQSVIKELAALRIKVFKDFPYLYEGNEAYEFEYLKTYINSPRSFLFGVFANDILVGSTTCIPLSDETAEVQEPFLKAEIDLATIFYFGESILLPQFRGLGLGNPFFDEREAHAKSFDTFTMTCFCSVVRDKHHLLRPIDYQPLDGFWTKRGYLQQPQLQSKFEWLDIGEHLPSFKTMVYWSKQI
jgi:hypothetical protein